MKKLTFWILLVIVTMLMFSSVYAYDYEWPILKKDSTGVKVKALQYLLNYRNATPSDIEVDSIFGDETFSALLSYQTKNNLTQTGTTTASTWVTLCPKLSVDSNKSQGVKALQVMLNRYSKYTSVTLVVDGIFGSKTETAVFYFKRNFLGIGSANGIADDTTWNALLGN